MFLKGLQIIYDILHTSFMLKNLGFAYNIVFSMLHILGLQAIFLIFLYNLGSGDQELRAMLIYFLQKEQSLSEGVFRASNRV